MIATFDIRAALVGAVLSVSAIGSAAAVQTCETPPPPDLDYIVPNDGGHDRVRVDRAIAHFTNLARCTAGLGPLVADDSVAEAARIHSDNMAALDEFGHDISAPGAEGMRDRLALAQVDYRLAAENIISGFFMQYEAGTPYRTIDAARCAFANEAGERMKRHTYLTLAEDLVAGWMASPGHRQNILTEGLRRQGAALAPNADGSLCGGFFVTQVFAG